MPLGNHAMHRGTAAVLSLLVVGWYWIEVSASCGMLSPFIAKNSSIVDSGNVQLLVVEVVVAAADLPSRADHREANVVDGDGLAQQRPPWKQQRCAFHPSTTTRRRSARSCCIEKAPLHIGTKRTCGKVRLDAQDRPGGVRLRAHLVEIVALQDRRTALHCGQCAHSSLVARA